MGKDEVYEQIQDCENRSEMLSEWELKFIDSISSQLGRNGSLSDKQLETLDKIWEKVTSGKSGATNKR